MAAAKSWDTVAKRRGSLSFRTEPDSNQPEISDVSLLGRFCAWRNLILLGPKRDDPKFSKGILEAPHSPAGPGSRNLEPTLPDPTTIPPHKKSKVIRHKIPTLGSRVSSAGFTICLESRFFRQQFRYGNLPFFLLHETHHCEMRTQIRHVESCKRMIRLSACLTGDLRRVKFYFGASG